MIYTGRTINVGGQESTIDKPILLYRGDRDILVEFTLVDDDYLFADEENVIKSTNASHGQLVLNTPSGKNMFTDVTKCEEGKVRFLIIKEMIDELDEVGFYSFQIRLFDESMISRVSIPPVMNGFELRRPIAAEDENNLADSAYVDYSIIQHEGEEEPVFDDMGAYIKTGWMKRDIISSSKLNKIENAIFEVNNSISRVSTNTESNISFVKGEILDTVTTIKNELLDTVTTIKTELDGKDEEIDNTINNINNILDVKASIDTTDELKRRIDTLVLGAVGDGNNPEVLLARGEFDTLYDRLDNIDDVKLNNISINLMSTKSFKGVSTNGSSYTENGNSYVVSCNDSWGGTFNYRVKVEYGKKYLFICDVKSVDGTDTGKTCWPTFYLYSESGSNLGGTGLIDNGYYTRNTSIKSEYNRICHPIQIDKASASICTFGVSAAQNVKFEIANPIIIDITGIDDSTIMSFDFKNIPYYKNYIDNFVISKYSDKSDISNKALNAELAVKANRADVAAFAEDGDFLKPVKKYKNLLGPIDSRDKFPNGVSCVYSGNEILVTPTASWGGEMLFRFRPEGQSNILITGRKYKVVCLIKTHEVDTLISLSCHMFSGDFATNKGAHSNAATRTTSEYEIYNTNVTIDKEDINTLAIGIKTRESAGNFRSFYIKDFMLIDITDLSENDLLELDTLVNNKEYWDNYPNVIFKAMTSDLAMNIKESVKEEIINNACIKANNKGIINESYNLEWTSKTIGNGNVSWWVANNSSNLTLGSTYIYIVKWEGEGVTNFNRCQELRNGAWYSDSTLHYQIKSDTNKRCIAWIFKTDTVTNPILCAVTSAFTAESEITLTTELYKIEDDKYIDGDFALDVAKAYFNGNKLSDYNFDTRPTWGYDSTDDVKINKWSGKKALVIGDSITAAGRWQQRLSEELGMVVSTHAKGGIGIAAMVDGDKGLQGDYDNETNASGTIYPLKVDDVKDKDLIVILPGYNERAREYGKKGDLYPAQSSITGLMQYMINRIYEELQKANNMNCKVLIATPHCAGKYNYVDYDGYDEYPSNSGRTMQTLSNKIKEIANYNNIPVCDLWHNSGINKFTWSLYGANPNPVDDRYTKYMLNEKGEVIGEQPMRYVKDNYYYQIRDGVVVYEQYTGSSPYPFNGDQLHCSSAGYYRIGECIVGSIISNYGY